ncbi:unnamed protein product [Closterium sp. NIES-53]
MPSDDTSLSFTLDSGASQCFFRDHTTLTPLLAPVPVALADASSGPTVARSSTTLLCPVVPSGVLRGLHIPLFTRNLVGFGYLQDRGITVTVVGGGRTAVCTHTTTGAILAMFTREPCSGLYILHTEHSPVTSSAQVVASPPVPVSSPVAVSSQYGQSQSCLRSPARLSVAPSLTCSTLHSLLRRPPARHSALLPTSWGPAPTLEPEREHYFLVVVDDYSRYTKVFFLAKKSEVTFTLIRWLLATEGTRGSRVRCLHFDSGGEFHSGVLAGFCGEQGIRQSWTLPESPQQNGVAERRIGLVIDITHTSMIHACAPHFLWPYTLRYAAHQLNLQPRALRPEVSPTRLWTGSPGVGSAFRVWGCLALVHDTSADKLSARAIPCLFLGFSVGSLDYSFYYLPLHQVLDSRDVWFDKSVSYYTRYPCRGLPVPPPPLFLAPTPPPAPAPPVPPPPPLVLPRPSPWLPSAPPLQVTVDSVGVGAGGASTGGASSGGAGAGGAGAGGASSGGAGAGGPGTGGASFGGVGAGGAGAGGASSGGTGAGGTGAGGAGSGGAGAGGADAVGASTEETGAGGTTTAPPHCYDTRLQALRRLECEEKEQLEQERQELQQLDQQQQQQPQPPLLQQLFPPASGLQALGLPSSPPIHSESSAAYGPTFPPPGLTPVVFSPPQSQFPRRSPPVSVLPSPPESSLTISSHPITDYYHDARPIVSHVLASLVTDPRASLSSVSALAATVADFSSTRRLDYATRVMVAPPPRRGVLEIHRHIRRRSSPPRANVVDGMWLFKVKRSLGSPPVFNVRYVARGFSQREGVDFFQTFAQTLRMTTLWVLLHVASQRDYELHSLDFSTPFLQGRLHEEIWLRRPPGFTDTFPPGTQWSLRQPVYSLRQSPREWHNSLRSMLRDLGFRPSSADPSLFVRTGSTPFFILVYVDDLAFATADRAALAEVKSKLQKRHMCTDLGELQRYLGQQITRDRAARTITLTQSHMVQQVLQRFGFQFSTTQPTPLAVDHRLTGPFPDESFESCGPYAELVGCLMYLMICTRLDLAFPLIVLSRFVATGRHHPVHWTAAVSVAKYLATTSGMGLLLGGTQPVVLTGHCDSSYADDVETQRSTQEAEIYAGAMAAQELRWLTPLLTDLGERPRSAPTLYADNKAMILLCQEPRLESIVKHIGVRYFLLRELQRRSQAHLDFVASEANTPDVFTKALAPGDHHRFCVQLGLVETAALAAAATHAVAAAHYTAAACPTTAACTATAVCTTSAAHTIATARATAAARAIAAARTAAAADAVVVCPRSNRQPHSCCCPHCIRRQRG